MFCIAVDSSSKLRRRCRESELSPAHQSRLLEQKSIELLYELSITYIFCGA